MLTLGLMALHDQKVMLYLIFIVLTQGIQLCHWLCHQHHVMPKPVPMITHDQKVKLHLILTKQATNFLCIHDIISPRCWNKAINHIDVIYCFVLAPWRYYIMYTSFWLSGCDKCSYAIATAISITWCQCQHKMHDMAKKSWHISFQ